MNLEKIVEENKNLSVTQKTKNIFNLYDKIEEQIKLTDNSSEMIEQARIGFGFTLLSMFLINENSVISKIEHKLYEDFLVKYAPEADVYPIETLQLLKNNKHDIVNQVAELADNSIALIIKHEGIDISIIGDLIVELLIIAAGIDGTLSTNEINHIMNLIDIESGAVTVVGAIGESKTGTSLQVNVEEMGASLKREDYSTYFSIGARIKNPNKNFIAKDVVVKVIGTNSSGNVVLTESETINNIDADSDFFFGATYSLGNGTPTNYKILVDADSFEEVETGTKYYDGIKLSTFSKSSDRWGSNAVSGTLKSYYNKRISWCDAHLVFKNKAGEIIGGHNFTLNDIFSNSEDAFNTTVNLDTKNATTIEHSIDIR